MKLNDISFADTNKRTRHGAAICPEGIGSSISHAAFDFGHLEVDHDASRMIARDCRWHIGRRSQDGVFDW